MDVQETAYLDIVIALLKDDVVLFDVGARKGEYTDLFLSKVKNKVTAHLFEPNEDIIEPLCKKYLSAQNVKVNGFAVSNENTTHDFYKITNTDNPIGGLSSLHFRPDVFNIVIPKKVTVTTETIDSYCEKNNITSIDFLKIDTEGNELNSLYGAEQLLKNKAVKFMQFEYGLCWKDSNTALKTCADYLLKYGYKIYCFDKSLKQVTSFENTYIFNNYLVSYTDLPCDIS